MLIFVRPESFPTQKKHQNGFKSHDVYYSLSWKNHGTPRFLWDVVGSHKHNSQKCMNCWFVLRFQQRKFEVKMTATCQKDSIQKIQHKKKTRYSTVSTFSFFQEILLFLAFKINRVNHQFTLKPSDIFAGTSYALSLTVGNPPASNVIGANQWKLLGLKNKICFELEESILFWHLVYVYIYIYKC